MNEQHRKLKSPLLVIALILALGALGIAGWAYMAVDQHSTSEKLADTQRDKAIIEGETDAIVGQVLTLCARDDRVATRLRKMGVCSDSRRVRAIVGPEGPPGIQGIPGPQGPPGPPGEQGPRGRQGLPGDDGTDGLSGSDGADGPAGTPGADGQDGVAGEPGPAGQTGETGAKGEQGEPPARWTWTDPGPPQRTYTCVRDDGSPDSEPTYTCVVTEGPP